MAQAQFYCWKYANTFLSLLYLNKDGVLAITISTMSTIYNLPYSSTFRLFKKKKTSRICQSGHGIYSSSWGSLVNVFRQKKQHSQTITLSLPLPNPGLPFRYVYQLYSFRIFDFKHGFIWKEDDTPVIHSLAYGFFYKLMPCFAIIWWNNCFYRTSVVDNLSFDRSEVNM